MPVADELVVADVQRAAPFTWTKTAEEILAKVRPARAALTQITP